MLTPVLCIPTGSGENQPAPIGTVGFLEFAGQVVNNGPAVSDATVVITLPDGLRLDPDSDEQVSRLERWWVTDSDEDGTPLDCTTNQDGSIATCSTGAVPAGANFLVLVDLAAEGNAVAGTFGHLTMALQSSPEPGTFPTTSVQATVDFVGTAHLQVHLTPTRAHVTVGTSQTLVATIHNVGPNEAVEASGFGFVTSTGSEDNPAFLITNSDPLPGFGSGSAFLARVLSTTSAAHQTAARKTFANRALADRTFANRTFGNRAATAPAPAPFGYWSIGTIAPGASASVTIVVRAESVGQVELDFGATSADESCDEPGLPNCENTATVDLSAVATVTTTATTAPATANSTSAADSPVSSVNGSTGTGVLANTGFAPTPWLGAAGAAILLGLGLMALGAPRRRESGGHHR